VAIDLACRHSRGSFAEVCQAFPCLLLAAAVGSLCPIRWNAARQEGVDDVGSRFTAAVVARKVDHTINLQRRYEAIKMAKNSSARLPALALEAHSLRCLTALRIAAISLNKRGAAEISEQAARAVDGW
jgi:hypothetical protein